MTSLFHGLAFCGGGILGGADLGLHEELANAGDPIGADRQLT